MKKTLAMFICLVAAFVMVSSVAFAADAPAKDTKAATSCSHAKDCKDCTATTPCAKHKECCKKDGCSKDGCKKDVGKKVEEKKAEEKK